MQSICNYFYISLSKNISIAIIIYHFNYSFTKSLRLSNSKYSKLYRDKIANLSRKSAGRNLPLLEGTFGVILVRFDKGIIEISYKLLSCLWPRIHIINSMMRTNIQKLVSCHGSGMVCSLQ